MSVSTFVCLANSRKHKGRCLAGKAFHNGAFSKWLRPVTEHSSQELQGREHHLSSGEDSAILDVLEIHLLEPKGQQHQQENWLMDVSVPLIKKGSLSLNEVSKLIDNPPDLWGIDHSSKSGLSNLVPAGEIQNHSNSLYLIDVLNFQLHIVEEYQSYKRIAMIGEFVYNNSTYKLKITDPDFERKFLDMPLGSYEIARTLLTISLGENFKNSYYKLIAGVIPIDIGKAWGNR